MEERRALFAEYAELPEARRAMTIVRVGMILSFLLLATPVLLSSNVYIYTFPCGLLLWYAATTYHKSSARRILLQLIATKGGPPRK